MIKKPCEYPRVLVVDATPFSRCLNNGIVKSNLFQGWPKSHLAQIDYSNLQPGFDVCERYWKLRKTDILLGLFGLAPDAALPLPEEAPLEACNAGKGLEYDNRPALERRLSFLNQQVRTLIGEGILRLPTALSGPLCQWIDNFQPDAVFSFMGIGPILRLAVKISQLRNIPIVPYYTDDWVTTLYNDNLLAGILRRNMLQWFHECLIRAPIRLTASDAMRVEYRNRYDGYFEAMLYPEEINGKIVSHQKKNTADIVQFLFIGHLSLNRWKSLRQIGEALLELRAKGMHAELQIYTFPSEIEQYKSSLTIEPVMRIMGTASAHEVLQLQRKADVLVHVESFERDTREYTKFSLSTKIPQYMMAGKCIFAYGPDEVASLRYLKENNIGVTVGQEDKQALSLTLGQLIKNKELRDEYGARANIVALERHEAGRQRKRFQKLIVQACESWRS